MGRLVGKKVGRKGSKESKGRNEIRKDKRE